MKSLKIAVTAYFFFLLPVLYGQKSTTTQGKLFIIGGGDRPPSLMQKMMDAASLKKEDYVVVLPMSGENPDTSFYYFKADLQSVCTNSIVNLNFTKANVNNTSRLDSLRKARLIFITGGDQDRFMSVVVNTPVYDAIHFAYHNGSTIAGTSAGAAVMSRHMITGNQLTDTVYRSTFPKVVDQNIEIKTGLGLLTNCIIDQHFIVRSRYNRLLSALAKFPALAGIGVDEATAIVVNGNTITVAGSGQVVVMRNPQQIQITSKGLIKLKGLEFSIYTEGDQFSITPVKRQEGIPEQ
ncbi:MAG: cyanophycinase [Chitinophagaceae bacterium]